MARKRKARKSAKARCKGLNSTTGKLKKGWRYARRKGRCPVKAGKKR